MGLGKSFFIVCLSLFFAAGKAQAVGARGDASEEVWLKAGRKSRTWLVIRHEDKKWIAERFVAEPGRLQTRESTHVFASRSQARAAMAKFIAGASAVPALTPLSEAVPLLTERPDAVVWAAENEWSDDWEARYSEWVKENLRSRFYIDRNIATDCADAAIASRWIFSRIHKLPAAQSLAATGALFTNESMRDSWASLPTHEDWLRDRRFLAALDYVLDNTYTHSLFRDSYPVKISLQTLVPGTHHLSLGQTSGHTLLVNQVDPQAEIPLRLVNSTIPRAVRELHEGGYWYTEQPQEREGGFLKIRWARKQGDTWSLKRAAEMTSYSKEQYQPEFMGETNDFSEAVLVHISPELDYRKRLKDGIANLKASVEARTQIVRDGYAYCSANDCSEGTQAYEDWSTPSRDKHLAELVAQLRGLVLRIKQSKSDLLSTWTSALKETALELEGQPYRLEAVLGTIERGSLDSDPRVPESERWRLAGVPFVTWLGARTGALLREREPSVSQVAETFDIDRIFRALGREAARYCEISPEADCQSYERGITELVFEVGGRRLPAKQWLERAFFMASDSSLPESYRWGDHGSRFEVRQMPMSLVVSASRRVLSGDLWMSLDQGTWHNLYDLPDMSLGDAELNLENSWLAAMRYDSGNNYILLDENLRTIGGLPSAERYPRWVSEKVVATETYDSGEYFVHFHRVANDSVVPLGKFSETNCYGESLCGVPVEGDARSWDIYDLRREAAVVPLRVRLPENLVLARASYARHRIETPNAYVLRGYNSDSGEESLVSIRKIDGIAAEIRLRRADLDNMLPTESGRWVFIQDAFNEVSLLELSAQGELISNQANLGTMEYIPMCYEARNARVGWITRGAGDRYSYRYAGRENVTTVDFAAGEVPIQICGSEVLVRTQDDRMRLYSAGVNLGLWAEADRIWVGESGWFAKQRSDRPDIVDIYHGPARRSGFVGWLDSASLMSHAGATQEPLWRRLLALGGAITLATGETLWLNEKL